MSATSFTLQATCLLLGAECAKRAWGGGNQRDGGRGGGVWVGVCLHSVLLQMCLFLISQLCKLVTGPPQPL